MYAAFQTLNRDQKSLKSYNRTHGLSLANSAPPPAVSKMLIQT